MKKSKKSNIVIVLVVLLLALAVGYAAFSTELKITGTATTKSGNWNVYFDNATITESTLVGDFDDNTATVSEDKKTVNVAAYLQAPGDGANVTATIKNAGKINAVLKSFEVKGDGFTKEGTTNVYKNGDIIVTVPDTTGGNIAAGQARNFVFSIEWNKDAKEVTTVQPASFEITFTYVQDGQVFNGVQSFDVVTTNN